ncbi:MAG: hypothetical protein N2450_05105 [bacterium]|nr:hypothetical protein [bacterium]
MSKKLLLVFLSLMVIVSSVFASGTSVLTLGNVGNVMKDRSNINVYPQTVIDYPYIATMTLSGGVYTLGGHYQFGTGYYGLYLDNLDVPEGGIYGPVVDENGTGENVTAPKLNFFYGRKLSEMPFGFNLSLYQNSWKSKATNDKTERSQMYLGLGFGITLMEQLEASLRFRNHTFTDKNAQGNDVSKPNGGMKLNLNARYWYELDEGVYLIPHLGFQMLNQGIDVTNVGKRSLSSTAIGLGAGFSSKMNDKAFFVSDVGIAIENSEDKTEPSGAPSVSVKTSSMVFPYYKFGFEGSVNNWMVGRFGAERAWTTYSDDNNTTGYENASSVTNLYLGAGFKKGNFALDLNLDKNLINRGPYFLTGSAGDWSTMASLTYTPDVK